MIYFTNKNRCFRQPLTVVKHNKQENSTTFQFLIADTSIPLTVKEAHLFSQILLSLTQKPSHPDHSQPDTIITANEKLVKPFSKHAPFLLVAFMDSKIPFDNDCKPSED